MSIVVAYNREYIQRVSTLFKKLTGTRTKQESKKTPPLYMKTDPDPLCRPIQKGQ